MRTKAASLTSRRCTGGRACLAQCSPQPSAGLLAPFVAAVKCHVSMHIHLYRSSCGLLHVCPCPIHVHVHVHVHVFMYVTMQACARRAPQPPAAHPLLALRDLRLAHPFWHDSLYKSITCPPRDYVASALRVRRFCMGLISCMIHRVQDTAILCIGCASVAII